MYNQLDKNFLIDYNIEWKTQISKISNSKTFIY